MPVFRLYIGLLWYTVFHTSQVSWSKFNLFCYCLCQSGDSGDGGIKTNGGFTGGGGDKDDDVDRRSDSYDGGDGDKGEDGSDVDDAGDGVAWMMVVMGS